jgi:predicted MFS family arabinose efflux permease
MASPLLACVVALRLPAEPGRAVERVPFYRVLGLIWRPGLVLTLATAPFAAMTAFLALDYAARDWAGAGAALGGFGGCYVLARLCLGHLPDRLGGARVAAVSLGVEALGQALLWLASGPAIAFAGACLTGLGFSLVFPSMGIEAMKSVSPDQRGRAVGNFIAFFDVAIGLTAPIVGLVAGRFGYASAFFVGLGATLVALAMLRGARPVAR